MNQAVKEAGELLRQKISDTFGQSLHIRHVDVGSCNGCDWEMVALHNPIYDLQRFGIDFVASPRHADLLMVTGVVTRNLEIALRKTFAATPEPKLVVAVGSCACGGGVFQNGYSVIGTVDRIIPVDVYIPGCPPRPEALLYGLLLALDKWPRRQSFLSSS
jgi:Ni,Fe-hydrogenase III small subunit